MLTKFGWVVCMYELRSPTCKLYLDLMSELVKKEKTNSNSDENPSSTSGAKPVSTEQTSETETKNKNGEGESKDFTGMSDDSIIDEIKQVFQKIEAEDYDSFDLEEVVLMATYHSKHQSYVKHVIAEVGEEWSWGDFEGDVHEDLLDFVDFATMSGEYAKNGHTNITPEDLPEEEPNKKPENMDTEEKTKTSEMMDDNDKLKDVELLETTKAIQDTTETTAAKLSEMENNQLESEKENSQPKNNTDPSGPATIHDHQVEHNDEKKKTEKDHSDTNDNKDSGLNKLESENGNNGANGVGSSTVGVVGAGASPDPAVEKPESKSMPVEVPDPAVEKPESKSMPVNTVEPEAKPAPAKPCKRKSEPKAKAKATASPKVVGTPKRKGRAPKAKSDPKSKAKAKVRVTGRSFRCHVTVTFQWASNFVEVVFSYLSDLSVFVLSCLMMVLLQCNNTQ